MVLSVAEAWGTPPWTIERTPGSARWMARFTTMNRLRRLVDGDDDAPPTD